MEKRKRKQKQRGGFHGIEDIPLHHRLTNRLFDSDYAKRQMYGLSHIREIAEIDNLPEEQKELEELENAVYEKRRKYLIEEVGWVYDNETVVGYDEKKIQDFYIPPNKFSIGFYLSYKLSRDTITELTELYERVRATLSVEDGIAFLMKALSLKDYVVNILELPEFIFNMRGIVSKRHYSDPAVKRAKLFYDTEVEIDKWINSKIGQIMSRYVTPTQEKTQYVQNEEHYMIVPKGTKLYRGFKTRGGPLNIERRFSFFVWDAIKCIQYTVPVEERLSEERKESNNPPVSELTLYCRAIGGVVEVETAHELKMLNMGKASTVRYLLSEMKSRGAPKKVIDSFKEAWKVGNDPHNNTYLRDSVYEKDMEVARWLVQAGYNGYVAMDVKGLHDEIVLFNIPDSVRIMNTYSSEDFNMPLCKEPYRSLWISMNPA